MDTTQAFGDRLRAACKQMAQEAERHDEEGADPVSLCGPLLAHGVFREVSPVDAGGVGLAHDPLLLCEALLAIGAANLSAARLFEGHVNAVQLIDRLGDEDQIAAFHTAVAGGAVSGVWNAEAPPGLRLVEDGRGHRLEGGKIYTSGIGLVTLPLVTARAADGGVSLLSPGPAPKAETDSWRARGMRATATGGVDYTGHAVDPSMRLGPPGAYYAAPHFKGGAWRFCAAQAGAVLRLQQLVSEALRLRGRIDDPPQRARQAELAIAAHTAQSWCRQAARMEADVDADPSAFQAFVGLTRLAVEAAATQAIVLAERSVGLSAFIRPGALDRVIRDLSTYLRQPFPDAVQDEAGAYMASVGGAPPWSVNRGVEP